MIHTKCVLLLLLLTMNACICIHSAGLFVCLFFLLFVFERMDWFANCIVYEFQLSVVIIIIIAQCKWNCMNFPHFHAAAAATTTEEKEANCWFN